MKKAFFISLLMILTSCASIHPVGDGKTHIASCPLLLSSADSCADQASDECPKGYEIRNETKKWIALGGARRYVTVVCK